MLKAGKFFYKTSNSLKISIFCLLLWTFLISLSTASPVYAADNEDLKSIKGNLKIVFIIDTSDSMNKGERFIRVKRALNGFVDSLIDGDYLIIVTFDSKAYLKYSGIVGDEKVRRAMKRVFDDNYPDNEPVRGTASQIQLGLDKAFREILDTPPYKSTAVVFFTDGDHNPIPPTKEWESLCSRIVTWRDNNPRFKDTRKVFVVDVGDPNHSEILADDLKIPTADFFPYRNDTDFREILEKIRDRIPYDFYMRVFPSVMKLGEFQKPKNIRGDRLIIINNGDFITRDGFVTPEIKYFRNGKEIQDPGFKINLPEKINKEFLAERLQITFDKNPRAGDYKVLVSFKPGGPLNAKLHLADEEGKVIDNLEISFYIDSWLDRYRPYLIMVILFLIILAVIMLFLEMQVKNMPMVTGKLLARAEGLDVSLPEADLKQSAKIFMFNHGKNVVTIGKGRDADIRYSGIDFLEDEHFQVEAETPYRYKIRALGGQVEILDDRDNPVYSGKTVKDGYKIKVFNPDKPDGEYVLFEIKNRELR